jgi:hypothetical protein
MRTRLLLLVALAAVVGCGQPKSRVTTDTNSPEFLDRMVAAYPDDLGTKKFQIIADFEDPRQAGLFHREPDKDPGAATLSTARAQPDTGVGSLRILLTGPTQHVVATDSPDAKWALPQDWAPYQMLLMSVFSPRDQGGFRFSIRSGTTTPLVYENPRIFLRAGWNKLRIDLADLAERIYLGDVREMQFWCDPLDSPIELYLDDLVLADNTREILANANSTPGGFSVRSRGRRIVVSVADRFEIVFSRGLIRQWFDLAADPQRMHNLAGTASLGPTPILLEPGQEAPGPADSPAQWARLGPLVESYQTALEVTPMRVVIHGEWRFGSPEAPFSDASPHHQWVYSVYRGGEVYVECNGSVKGLEVREVGIVFGCDSSAGFERVIGDAGKPGSADSAPYVLFGQHQRSGSADLLVVPSPPLDPRPFDNDAAQRLGVLYRVPVEGDRFVFTGLIRVWPNDIDGPAQASPMAAAYVHALPITVDTGNLVKTDPGDYDANGYNEARGCYVIQLDGRVAKIRLNGAERLRFSPVFKLVDVSEYDVWVYVDGRQIRSTRRDQTGNLFFEIPGVIAREVLIEITATKKAPEPRTAGPAAPK